MSVYKDGDWSSSCNKTLVQKLQEFRKSTQNDEEPPVTLLHGAETETVIRHSLMRIKIQQQEEIEEQKRKARENGEEVDEEDEQMTMTADESKEETTFQTEMT